MIYLFKRLGESDGVFERALNALPKSGITVTIKNNPVTYSDTKLSAGDILVVSELYSLGATAASQALCLQEFVNAGIIIIICSYPATYEYGILQEVNRAAVMAIAQTLDIKPPKKVGRPRVSLPPHWEEDYESWRKKEITSAEFIERSGLKRATFYNVLAQYNSEMQEEKLNARKLG